MSIEREIGKLIASVESLHEKVDDIKDTSLRRHDDHEMRLRVVERFRYKAIGVIALIGTGIGGAGKALISKLNGMV